MATITQRANGSWQAKIRRRGRPPQSDTFRTKALAERWGRQIENEMDRGIFVDRSAAERLYQRRFNRRNIFQTSGSRKRIFFISSPGNW